MRNFWNRLSKPFFVLAPMADVTDCAFRQIIAKYGRPDVFYTEFVSADGLCSPGREKLLIDLKYGKNEHPIVAQIFGGKPHNIKEAAKLCAELGFDGVDINMGCPDKSVEKQCAGATMIKNPALAKEIIAAAKEGAPELPISVKTRLGYNKIDLDWIREILSQNITTLIVHLRTRKEMSLVPAHWDQMKKIVEIRNEIAPQTLIIGNGDVVDTDDARQKCEEYGCYGVMLGRAIFGNPWLFARKEKVLKKCLASTTVRTRGIFQQKNIRAFREELSPEVEEKLNVMLEHTKLFEKLLGEHKNFAIMKKHYKAYVNGFEGAKELRMKLMEAENADEVEKTVKEFLK